MTTLGERACWLSKCRENLVRYDKTCNYLGRIKLALSLQQPTLLQQLHYSLLRDEDTVVFGYRNGEATEVYGEHNVRTTQIYTCNLDEVRQIGVKQAALKRLDWLLQKPLDGFWIHLDADVLDDTIMPAVDYRMPDGFSFEELTNVLQVLIASPKAIGIDITIFIPKLDLDGSIAYAFTQALVAGLTPRI